MAVFGLSKGKTEQYAIIAQLIERLFCNQMVEGLNPSGGSNHDVDRVMGKIKKIIERKNAVGMLRRRVLE